MKRLKEYAQALPGFTTAMIVILLASSITITLWLIDSVHPLYKLAALPIWFIVVAAAVRLGSLYDFGR